MRLFARSLVVVMLAVPLTPHPLRAQTPIPSHITQRSSTLIAPATARRGKMQTALR
ncbi:MAG TPA: hypothetical protein VL990_02815 [Acidobacteriaceae bacterium]|nr:hypothetical protein [Acidobacteriaceae bacterium]